MDDWAYSELLTVATGKFINYQTKTIRPMSPMSEGRATSSSQRHMTSKSWPCNTSRFVCATTRRQSPIPIDVYSRRPQPGGDALHSYSLESPQVPAWLAVRYFPSIQYADNALLLIHMILPNHQRIEVPETVVRWSRGDEFAVEMKPPSPLQHHVISLALQPPS
jgi:hypothetical protein